MYKVSNVIISPIIAVINDLGDMAADFILCSSNWEIPVYKNSNVLFLHFFDTENFNHPMRFRDSHAEQIVTFLSKENANEDLFVCCDSGESRSSAIAAAIQLAVGHDDRYIWDCVDYHPNQLVFEALCQKLGVNISKQAIKSRKEINNSALEKAILSGRKQGSFQSQGIFEQTED